MIGSVLNGFLGYSTPWFLIGALIISAIIPIYNLLPPDSELKSAE